MNTALLPFSDGPPTCPAEELLSRAALELSAGFTQLEAFRVTSTAGIEAGLQELEARYRPLFRDLPRILAQPYCPFPANLEETFFAQFRPKKRADVAIAIDAACLVFAHALFEALLHDLFRVARLTRRTALLRRIPNRSLPVGALLDNDLDTQVDTILDAYVQELTRSTLRQKVEALLDLFRCRGPFDTAEVRFDLERLIAIDRHRQALLHSQPFTPTTTSTPIAADVDFLYSQGNLLIAIVALSAALEISVVRAIDSARESPSA